MVQPPTATFDPLPYMASHSERTGPIFLYGPQLVDPPPPCCPMKSCSLNHIDPRARAQAAWDAASANSSLHSHPQYPYQHHYPVDKRDSKQGLGATVYVSHAWPNYQEAPMTATIHKSMTGASNSTDGDASSSSASASISPSPRRGSTAVPPREAPLRPSSRAAHDSSSTNSHHSARHSHRHSVYSHTSRPELAYIRDPEKGFPRASVSSSQRSVVRVVHTDYKASKEMDGDNASDQIPAVKTLLFLSGLCVGLSILNAVWAALAMLLAVLAQPLRLCTQRPDLSRELAGLLRPTLNLQLRGIYAPPLNMAEDTDLSAGRLIMIHLLSPFLSFVIAAAGWITATYWTVSAMLGDPAGQDRRDDGRELVLALRKWWLRWLMLCVPDSP